MFNKFFVVLVVALVMFSCGVEATKIQRNAVTNNMEAMMAGFDVNGGQKLGEPCSFWTAKWCSPPGRCSGGICKKE